VLAQLPVTPRSLPEPTGPKPIGTKTLARWDQFLGSIAAGTGLAESMQQHYITRADIEACVRSGPEEAARWENARLAALKRNWSIMDLEDLFERIAGGMCIQDAVTAVKGNRASFYNEILRLLVQDPDMEAMYQKALKARSLHTAEEIVAIADDDRRDVIAGPKGDIPNMAAVNRSRLKVETRTRLMESWNTRMFGKTPATTTVNVQVNHAARREEARTRAKTRKVDLRPKSLREAIDATFAETTAPDEDTTWLEVKANGEVVESKEPTDMSWLE
jgi:hypothetical protein